MKPHDKIRSLVFALMAFAMSASAFIPPTFQSLEKNLPKVGNAVVDELDRPVNYTYDGIDRLRRVDYSDGTFEAFDYDENSNLTGFSNQVSGVSFAYDEIDQLTNVTSQVSGFEFQVSYSHDSAGQVPNMTSAVGNSLFDIGYSYDSAGQVTNLNSQVSGFEFQVSFSYDPNGNLTNIVYPNGVTAERVYDAGERLESYSYSTNGTPFIQRSFQRDDLGQKHIEDVTAGTLFKPSVALEQTLANNDGDQLTSTSTTLTNATVLTNSLAYNGAGCLVQRTENGGQTTVYSYDCANRLVSISNLVSRISYLYDATGSCIGRITDNGSLVTTNLFVLNYSDSLKRPIVETDGFGHVTRFFIWGPSGLLAHLDVTDNGSQITVNSIRYYHADELGSTLALTDENGNLTDEFGYTPYGEQLGHIGSTQTPYCWLAGLGVRVEDEAQQLFYMNRRFYSASLKRFLTRDPSGLDGGPNAYLYAAANPLFFVDPSGFCPQTIGSSYSSPSWASSVPNFNYSFEDSLRDTMTPYMAAASVFNPGNIAQGIANEYQANYNYSGSHYDALNLTFNPITKLGVNAYQAATGNGISYNNYGTQLSTGQKWMSGGAAVLNAFEAVGVGYGATKLLTASGVTAPLENFAARKYLSFVDPKNGSSLYNSFVPGTARLNVGLGGKKVFRAADSAASATSGRFASVGMPQSAADAIQQNALAPIRSSSGSIIWQNNASDLWQVTTRSGFSVQGTVASQGVGFEGGAIQIFQSRPIPTFWNKNPSPWRGPAIHIGYPKGN